MYAQIPPSTEKIPARVQLRKCHARFLCRLLPTTGATRPLGSWEISEGLSATGRPSINIKKGCDEKTQLLNALVENV